jgi:hypothetical protein
MKLSTSPHSSICAFCMISNKQHLLPYTTHPQQIGFYNTDGLFAARDEPRRVYVTQITLGNKI